MLLSLALCLVLPVVLVGFLSIFLCITIIIIIISIALLNVLLEKDALEDIEVFLFVVVAHDAVVAYLKRRKYIRKKGE